MKILVVGDGHSQIHEVAVTRAFQELGHEVQSFYWHPYLISKNKIRQVVLSAQNKFIKGLAIRQINDDLIAKAKIFGPELVFIYRGTHIFKTTVRKLKELSSAPIVVGYNNDDPFAPGHPVYLWKTFLESVPEYDLVMAYRHHNIPQFITAGAKRVELLRSWFLPWQNRPISLSAEDLAKFQSDVSFIGHFEDDGRKQALESIVKKGWKLRLFGPTEIWRKQIAKSPELNSQLPVRMVWGDDYNRALCGSKIALCFLSKLNRDTYTRRCFEIPSTNTMLLSEYTDDLASLFIPGKEADYFRNEAEMIEKIEYYLQHDAERMSIADAGFKKVFSVGHDIVSRMKQVLESVAAIKTELQTNHPPL